MHREASDSLRRGDDTIRRGCVFLSLVAAAMAAVGHDRAIGGTVQPAVIAGPDISTDVLTVASRKDRGKNGTGRKYKRGLSHLEALAICRKRHGWSSVARVTIRKDGSFICHRPVVRR